MHTVVAPVSGCRFHRAKARTRHGDGRRRSVHPACHAHAYVRVRPLSAGLAHSKLLQCRQVQLQPVVVRLMRAMRRHAWV